MTRSRAKWVKGSMGLLVQSTMDEISILTSIGKVSCWDLRKIKKWIYSIQVSDEEAGQVSYAVTCDEIGSC